MNMQGLWDHKFSFRVRTALSKNVSFALDSMGT